MAARYFRFGPLSTAQVGTSGEYVSRNHRDGGVEAGLSVYAGSLDGDVLTLDLRTADQLSALFIIDAADCWEVSGGLLLDADDTDEWGDPLGQRARGADGEPLLYGGPDPLEAYGVPAPVSYPIITAARVAVRQIKTIR